MTRLQRPCLGVRLQDNTWEGCGELLDPGKSRCPRHERAEAARKPSAEAKGYDRGYRADRARVLEPDARTGLPPLCELRLPGCTHYATTADHVFERVDGERLPDELGGRLLRPACAHCNSARRGQRTPDRAESSQAPPDRTIVDDDDGWFPPP